jgi:hypothetical protein
MMLELSSDGSPMALRVIYYRIESLLALSPKMGWAEIR